MMVRIMVGFVVIAFVFTAIALAWLWVPCWVVGRLVGAEED